MADSSECGNEDLGFIKCGEFLDLLGNDWLFKKDCAPWNYLVI